MNEYDLGSCGGSRKRNAHRHLGDKAGYLLSAEDQLLQSISDRATLPEVLNRICGALDSQIGNVVSLVSLLGDDASKLATIAINAALFGLHTFWSEGVVAENDEPLGSLEMYCCVQRRPSREEFRLIERAKCLAAIAIKRHNEVPQQGSCGMRGNRPMRGRVLAWPASTGNSSSRRVPTSAGNQQT
jgi:GAF domain-containing protein